MLLIQKAVKLLNNISIAKMYWNKLILFNTIKFNDIPNEYKEDIKIIARKDVEAGKLTKVQYKRYFNEPYFRDNT